MSSEVQPLAPSSSAPSPAKSPLLIPAPSLASSRYNRQLLIPAISLRGQVRIAETKVLIIGLGGLGCPAALYLAGAGVHTLGLIDGDTVEASNLHRQILHREDSVGWRKVDSAIRGLKDINSEINYVGYKERLSASNALEIVAQYDLVLDCSDNPATRYLASDACVLLGRPLVSGAAQRTEGQLMVLNYPVAEGPCYRCVFPWPPAPETVLGCSEIGVLGPAVGVVGVLMAAEAIRLVVEGLKEEGFRPSLLLYNAWSKDGRGRFRGVGLRAKRSDCVACGDGGKEGEKITWEGFRDGRMDYEAFCGRVEDVRVLTDEERVRAPEFLRVMGDEDVVQDGMGPLVVDVREPNEVELGIKIAGSVNIPISRILRHGAGGEGGEVFDELRIATGGDGGSEARPVFFVCQRGNDSQIAARKMLDLRKTDRKRAPAPPLQWIGDVEGGLLAIEREAATLAGQARMSPGT